MTLQSDILSIVTSGFLKQLIILKSFNSVFYLFILFCDEQTYIAVSILNISNIGAQQTNTNLLIFTVNMVVQYGNLFIDFWLLLICFISDASA